jgi:hypothetical protein
MQFLMPLAAAAAEATQEATSKVAEVAGGGTQEAIDHALWQYPVAALVIFVIIIFLRDRKKSDERQQEFLSETNKLDREDREKAQSRFTDTLKAVQTTQSDTLKAVQVAQSDTIEKAVDSFSSGLTQATSQSNALMARAIDTIDRNTEAFGEVKALVEITRNQQAMRDDDEEDEVEVRVVKKRKKKRKPKPKPEPEPEEDEYEDEDEAEGDEE